MDKIIIRGGNPLYGSVCVGGAKNAILPILAASILADGKVIIRNVPYLDDVSTMVECLVKLGLQASFVQDGIIAVIPGRCLTFEAPYNLVRKMRASFLLAGPLLAKLGRARVALPGGCAIGARPIDLHLKGFAAMGGRVVFGKGYVEITSKRLSGARVYLDFPSVGATENIMMAATLANGVTVIENCAEEPEIVDLANCLNGMGAKIRGAGTNVVKIDGVEHLEGTDYSVIPDRIEAGTYMIAGVISRGDIILYNVIAEHLKAIIAKIRETGAQVADDSEGFIRVSAQEKIKPVDIKTLPYPGFPTDLQPQMMALMSIADGCSVITETVFDNRFLHADELRRMGACIKLDGRSALVRGVKKLSGAPVRATDLRAGAGLVLAGLVASGTTQVSCVNHIDRGYSNLTTKLCALGADIERVSANVCRY